MAFAPRKSRCWYGKIVTLGIDGTPACLTHALSGTSPSCCQLHRPAVQRLVQQTLPGREARFLARHAFGRDGFFELLPASPNAACTLRRWPEVATSQQYGKPGTFFRLECL